MVQLNSTGTPFLYKEKENHEMLVSFLFLSEKEPQMHVSVQASPLSDDFFDGSALSTSFNYT